MSTALVIDQSKPPKRWQQIYGFTTENISGYLDLAGKPKRALSVIGSGDHVLNLIFAGAREIWAFDINPGASHWLELKLAALQRLSRDEYLQFFMRSKSTYRMPLCGTTFQLFSDRLSPQARHYFEKLYTKFGLNLRESQIFNNLHDNPRVKLKSNPYLKNEIAYERARALAATVKLELKCCPVEQTLDWASGAFDCIMLSNLTDYVHIEMPGLSPLRIFRETVIAPLLSRLTRHGVMFAAYVYNAEPNQAVYRSEIDNPKCRMSVFGSMPAKYFEHSFESVMPGCKDLTVVLKGKPHVAPRK